MNNRIYTYLLTSLIVIIVASIAKYVRKKFYKPKNEEGVQKPGKLETFYLIILVLIDVLFLMMMVLGITMKETEMVIVSGVLALFILVIIVFLKYAYKTSYQENDEYLILKARNKEYKVFYKNIIDWKYNLNEMSVLDRTRLDKKYIKINTKIFKPEILLRKIADMTFDGSFHSLDKKHLKDPNRENEIVYYLVNNNYGYLIQDYIEKNKDKFLK